MFISNLQAKFGIVRDTRSVSDPWGFGLVFEIARLENREYQEFVKRRQSESPIMAALFRAIGKAQFRSLAKGQKAPTAETIAAAYEEAAEGLEITASDLEAFGITQREGCAKHILRGWRGLEDLHGREIKFSPEAALELLRSPEIVPEERPYGGKTLGDALLEWIMEEAGKGEAYREAFLEQSGKASEPRSGGDSEGSSD